MIKVVIVEDEAIIRNSIQAIIDWPALNCVIACCCKNGFEAIEYVKTEEVHLVITDIRMPKMNGLELCKAIKSINPSIQMVILSAYTDFSYTQEAIKIGVTDYVSKSNFIYDLPLAVKSAISKIQETTETNENTYLDLPEELLNTLIVDGILSGKIKDENKVFQWLRASNLKLSYYFIMLVDIVNIHGGNIKAILDFYNLSFMEMNHFIYKMDSTKILMIIDFEHDNEVYNLSRISSVCMQMSQRIKNYMPFDTVVGISKQHHHVSEIPEAFIEAQNTVMHILEMNTYCSYSSLLEIENVDMESYNDVSQSLIALISDDDLEGANDYLRQLFLIQLAKIEDITRIKFRLMMIYKECISDINNYVVDHDKVKEINKLYNSKIAKDNSIRDLYETSVEFVRALSEVDRIEDSARNNHLADKVCRYIYSNYADDIKLEDIASELYINTSYLSRMFKKVTGKSIIYFLNEFRIGKAKTYLSDTDYTIAEVGELIGIGDPSYFSSVFTKYEKMSPKKYRQLSKVKDI